MSKGSTQRPTDKAKFDENFDRIFKKKDEYWEHYCAHGGYAYLPKEKACVWCDAQYKDTK